MIIKVKLSDGSGGFIQVRIIVWYSGISLDVVIILPWFELLRIGNTKDYNPYLFKPSIKE